MAEKTRQYVAIDAKSFYASVECVERHLNPLTTNLVVADESRTEKTICLAVSPALKAHKVPGRPRLFEVIQRIREVNRERLKAGIRSGAIRLDPETREYRFSSASFDAEALAADPSLEVSYIVAPRSIAQSRILHRRVQRQRRHQIHAHVNHGERARVRILQNFPLARGLGIAAQRVHGVGEAI